jgi:hypothetical protein
MCAAIFLVPPTWDLRDFGKWLIDLYFHDSGMLEINVLQSIQKMV